MMVCTCGALVQAPTLLHMTFLEPVAAEAQPIVQSSGAAWGLRTRMRLLGVVLVLAALIGGVWLFVERPTSRFDMVDPEQLRETAKSLPPLRTWQIWEQMKQGLDRRIDQQYAAAVQRFRLWQLTVAVAAVLGIGLVVAGTMGMKKPLTASG
jgi:hypothetical protein